MENRVKRVELIKRSDQNFIDREKQLYEEALNKKQEYKKLVNNIENKKFCAALFCGSLLGLITVLTILFNFIPMIILMSLFIVSQSYIESMNNNKKLKKYSITNLYYKLFIKKLDQQLNQLNMEYELADDYLNYLNLKNDALSYLLSDVSKLEKFNYDLIVDGETIKSTLEQHDNKYSFNDIREVLEQNGLYWHDDKHLYDKEKEPMIEKLTDLFRIKKIEREGIDAQKNYNLYVSTFKKIIDDASNLNTKQFKQLMEEQLIEMASNISNEQEKIDNSSKKLQLIKKAYKQCYYGNNSED